MKTYTIRGRKTGGWDRSETATSLRRARQIARDMRDEYPADDSGSSVVIERGGERVEGWRGSAETRKWYRAA